MAIRGATILITGGAGFIGSALAARLVDENRVRILDNLKRDAIGKTSLLSHPNVELIKADVRDEEAVNEAVEGADYIVHMASLAGVDTVIRSPVETMEVALLGTMNVLRAARAVPGLRRLIDFSTSEVFGSYAFRVQEADVTSLGAVGEARWTYAVSKLATEHLANNYYKQYDLPTCSIRPFNIYGPGQVGEGAIHNFVVRALKNEPIHIHNEGDQIRAWCFIDDIVDAVLLTLENERAIGEAFNIGNARSAITIYQLARLIVRLSESKSPIEFIEWNFPDVDLRIPDIRKAERLLGFRAKIELEDGLLRTIAWYREAQG